MDLGLTDKIAMIGGASKGLGFAVARALAAEGVHLCVAARDEGALCRAAEAIKHESDVNVVTVPADLSRADAIALWHSAAVREFGGVDLLFANTGGPPPGTALAASDCAWQSAFDQLLMSVIRTVRLVIPSMRARGGGSILIGTSSSVREPLPNLALSNVMRVGVTSLAKTLAVEVAPDNIRVNTLVPGRIATSRVEYLDTVAAGKAGITPEDQRKRSEACIPLGRYGAPDEFGRVAAFLLSDRASYITGSAVVMDGGLLKGMF
jgi:3-oxoacyl-[acyl-carrier protein] reductase